jgi:hypothetical protein
MHSNSGNTPPPSSKNNFHCHWFSMLAAMETSKEKIHRGQKENNVNEVASGACEEAKMSKTTNQVRAGGISPAR